MANPIVAFCDAMAAELRSTVAGLGTLTDDQVHLYLPVPEDEVALGGERHLGIWIISDTTVPLMSETHERTSTYAVSVWENMAEAGARLAQDVGADLAFTDLYFDVENRLYTIQNEFMGGTELSWPTNVLWGSASGMIRKFAVPVQTKRLHAFS